MEPILSGSDPPDLDLCWGKHKEQESEDEGSRSGSLDVACDLGPTCQGIFVKREAWMSLYALESLLASILLPSEA